MNATSIGKGIFFATVLVAVASFLISLSSDGAVPGERPAVFVHSPDPERFPVTLTAWLASDRVRAGEAFWIEYELRNGAALAARDTRLEPLSGSDWSVTGWEERSVDRWVAQPPDFAPRVNLVPGEVRRFRARAVIAHGGSIQLQTAYSHTWGGLEQERSHNVAVIGPLRVDSLGRSLGAALQSLITTLLLPLLLAGLAWFLPYAEAKSRGEREAREAQVAEQNAQAHQTWNLLLPYSLQISTKYYMPACSSILALQREYDRRAATGNNRAVLHALLLFMRHMRDCRDETGGIHFKHRLGEQMAGRWFKVINDILNREFPLLVREQALDVISSKESFGQFEERFTDWKTKALFADLETSFSSWCTRATATPVLGFGEYLPLFQVFRAVVQFEVNRPLEFWYQELEDSADVRTMWDKVKNRTHTEIAGWDALLSLSADYVEKIETLHKP